MAWCELLAAYLAMLGGLLGVKRPAEQWEPHTGVNCFSGYGATDLEARTGYPCGSMTLEQCQAKCDELPACQGITVNQSSPGLILCFRRGDIDLGKCVHNTGAYDTYIKTAGPAPSPTPPPQPPAPSPTPPPQPSPVSAGTLGCGVAIAGDWPNCGRQFDEDYHFDLQVLMRNANDVAPQGRVWRYDWRSTQHPLGGDWTYTAMDWCSHGGKWEHPDPNGPWPGLMGWNEPNVPSQCNQPPGDGNAVGEFVALARRFKELGKYVVSPAPSQDAPWLDTFLGVCEAQGFKGVDYLAYHHYVTCDQSTSGDAMYGEVSRVMETFIGLMRKYNARGFDIKGLWITEIACAPSGGWGHQPYHWVPGKPELLMSKFVEIQGNYRELATWSWFGYNGFGQLWDPTTLALTPLGRMYFQNCLPGAARGNETVPDSGSALVVV